MSKWNEPSGQVVYNCIQLLQNFATLLKKDIAMIAEKHRDLGFVNENLEAAAENLAINHYPQAKRVLTLFVNTLNQIEFSRKVMYTRTHQLSEVAFQNVLDQAKNVQQLLKAREQAVTKYMQALAAKQKAGEMDRKKEMHLKKVTNTCVTANTQALYGVSTFVQQFHKDLVLVLSSFAHAQMELYTHIVEVCGNTIEEVDQIDIEDDTEKVVEQMQKVMRTIPA